MNKENNTVGSIIRECRKEMGYSRETLAAMLYMKKTTICKYEKDEHDIPSSVMVELAKALHTTPNYLLLGDIETDDWMDDMIQILQKISKSEYRELAKKQIELIVRISVIIKREERESFNYWKFQFFVRTSCPKVDFKSRL